MAGIPVVVAANGKGIPVTQSTRGAPATVATNGRGIPVVLAATGGMALNISGLAPPPDPVTFYDQATTTGMAKTVDNGYYTLGAVFTFAKAGYIDAISMWKPSGYTQDFRDVGVWTTGGVLLTRGSYGTFALEAAGPRWVIVSLQEPIAVTAGQTLVVGSTVYLGGYASATGFFNSAVVRGDITGPATAAVGGNGRLVTGASTNLTYPDGTFNGGGYYVDVRYFPLGTIPAKIPAGYPKASNTGARGTLTAYTGPDTITTPNTVIENKQITIEQLRVNTSGVVIRNCRIDFTADYGINAIFGTDLTVEDCTIVGPGSGGDTNSCINGQGIFRRNDLSGSANGLVVGAGASTVTDNYVHDLRTNGVDPHIDGIAVQGGQTSVLIEHNTVISTNTSCVFIKNDFGAVANVTVNNNLLLADAIGGPSFLIYVNNTGTGDVTGTVITNNLMSTNNVARYATISPGVSVTVSGNVNAYSGLPI